MVAKSHERWPGDGSCDTNLRLAGQVAHSHGWLGSDASTPARTPEILRDAFPGPCAWQRLERFVAASRHPTMRAAAEVLGLKQPTLVTQINRLERDLGQALLERAQRGRAMKPAPFGETVLAAA